MEMLPKIIGIILGVAVTGLFAWKFKGTLLFTAKSTIPRAKTDGNIE